MTFNLTPTLTVPTASPTPFVLLVDDHESCLAALHDLVEAAGYECVATSTASEALVYCDRRRPSVVVTDLAMPKLDGQGLARWIKARFPAVPMILVTGEMLDSEATDRLRSMFAAVLTKPIKIDLFLALLEELMAARPGHCPRA